QEPDGKNLLANRIQKTKFRDREIPKHRVAKRGNPKPYRPELTESCRRQMAASLWKIQTRYRQNLSNINYCKSMHLYSIFNQWFNFAKTIMRVLANNISTPLVSLKNKHLCCLKISSLSFLISTLTSLPTF